MSRLLSIINTTIDNKSSILLHLVGVLSSRSAHDARSQEHKIHTGWLHQNGAVATLNIAQAP